MGKIAAKSKTCPMTGKIQPGRTFRLLLGWLLSAMTAWLGYLVLGIESASVDLVARVVSNLEISGASNPVTAVLLNFRGYDTLLEMGVLLLALLGVWSLGAIPKWRESAARPVTVHVPQMLVPVLILVSGYLLWAGAHAPGGAFQAGSLLGAAGVLLLLCGGRVDERFSGPLTRFLLCLGLMSFIAAAVFPLFAGAPLFQYPPALAASIMLVIETAATLSIGLILAALFLGELPGTGDR